jgi:hypothetical protein
MMVFGIRGKIDFSDISLRILHLYNVFGPAQASVPIGYGEADDDDQL